MGNVPVVYNEIEIQTGLRVLALCGGNITRAHKQLAGAGKHIPKSTLRDWRNETYCVRYEEILADLRQEIGEKVSDEAMEIAGQATQVEKQLIEELQEKLHEIPEGQLAKSALAMAQSKEINTRTARMLRDQPTSITEVRDPDDIIAELKHLGLVQGSVDSTAEEV